MNDEKQVIKRMKCLSKIIDEKRSDLEPEEIFKNFDSCCRSELNEYRFLYQELIMNTTNFKMREIPEYGDHMTIENFVKFCRIGGFIDYDGSGNYAQEDKMSNITILPSDVTQGRTRNDFTHVVWFNR